MGVDGLGNGPWAGKQGSPGPERQGRGGERVREAEATGRDADGMGENPSGWIGFVMQAGHGLIRTPPPKCRLQFWARWHHVPADCDMSDGTWSRLLVTAVHRVVTFPRSLSVSVRVSSLSPARPPRGQARIMKGALSIPLSIRPGIDNVKSTKPALGSTECCCRFNQAGLLRNDRPPLLRFPKPVPVPALLWSFLPCRCRCHACLPLPFCCLIPHLP